jgi:hypothetical protein
MPSPFNSLSTRWINWILNSTSLLASQRLHNIVGWSLFAFSLFLYNTLDQETHSIYILQTVESSVSSFWNVSVTPLPSSGDNCSSLQAILYLYNGHMHYNNTCSIWIGTQSSWSFANMDIWKTGTFGLKSNRNKVSQASVCCTWTGDCHSPCQRSQSCKGGCWEDLECWHLILRTSTTIFSWYTCHL